MAFYAIYFQLHMREGYWLYSDFTEIMSLKIIPDQATELVWVMACRISDTMEHR